MQKCLIITVATALNLHSHFEDIQQTWTELKLYRIRQMVTGSLFNIESGSHFRIKLHWLPSKRAMKNHLKLFFGAQ